VWEEGGEGGQSARSNGPRAGIVYESRHCAIVFPRQGQVQGDYYRKEQEASGRGIWLERGDLWVNEVMENAVQVVLAHNARPVQHPSSPRFSHGPVTFVFSTPGVLRPYRERYRNGRFDALQFTRDIDRSTYTNTTITHDF